MKNRQINIAAVEEIAEALGEIKNDMVFVGGAIVSLYADDPAADEVRPTQDIDLTIRIINLNHWEKVQTRLKELGFYPDPFGHAICSYKYKDIPVDIMSADDGPLGPSNPWYKIGFENLWSVKALNQDIKILSAPCYLASKFDAFNNRGKDYRSSHDMEDIIYVIDNRINLVGDMIKDHTKIISFLQNQLQMMIQKGVLTEVLVTHIHPLMQKERMPIIENKIKQIIEI